MHGSELSWEHVSWYESVCFDADKCLHQETTPFNQRNKCREFQFKKVALTINNHSNCNIWLDSYVSAEDSCKSYTYLLTPWCRVLLEKPTGLQLVKKFPAFHGTRRFITALTSFRHLSLSWASPIQSIYPHPTSWRSILILSTHLRLGLPSGLLPSGYRRCHCCCLWVQLSL